MKITVIVCTYNRCQSLIKALNGIASQSLPVSVEWEVLVVDNNSSDQTREVAENFCREHPGRFRYVFEPQQGLCHARNAGIREARGEILVFTDDDVLVEAEWLQNLTAAMHDSTWAGAGGRIVPERTFSPPAWLSIDSNTAAVLVFLDLGEKACELDQPPFGANMAFRKDMFEKYGGFRTDLGRVGNNLMSGEDSEFGFRLLKAGERLCYEPSAVVYHPVNKERIQKSYFLRWQFYNGRSEVRCRVPWCTVPSNTKYFSCGVPLYLFRRLAMWTLRWMVAVEPRRRFECKLTVWALSGRIAEYFHQQSLDAIEQKG